MPVWRVQRLRLSYQNQSNFVRLKNLNVLSCHLLVMRAHAVQYESRGLSSNLKRRGLSWMIFLPRWLEAPKRKRAGDPTCRNKRPNLVPQNIFDDWSAINRSRQNLSVITLGATGIDKHSVECAFFPRAGANSAPVAKYAIQIWALVLHQFSLTIQQKETSDCDCRACLLTATYTE